MHDYWQRQAPDTPLFPDLLWSRPENRQFAGKLLIVGGNAQGFAAPAEAFAEAGKAGIGTARVMLPDVLRKTVGRAFPDGEFAPSTPSGSFSRQALAELLPLAGWSDSVLFAGDLGRNSETAILLETFADKYAGQLVISKDAADYFVTLADFASARPDTLLVLSFAQAQRLIRASHFPQALTFNMDLMRVVELLHNFSAQHACHIVTKHLDTIFVAVNGRVSTTKISGESPVWRVKTAAHAATWWLQNPQKPFESITTATI